MEDIPREDVQTKSHGDNVTREIDVEEKSSMEVDEIRVGAGAAVAYEASQIPIPLDLYPAAHELPPRPPPANECNYSHFYAIDVGKEYHDQYVFRHHNGLCVIGLASTHAAFMIDTELTGVDYNVGKTSRAEIKAVGKRKKNAQVLESNSVLCKVLAGETFFLISFTTDHLTDAVSEPDTEGYIAIMMPRPEDWKKAQASLLTKDQYRERRGILCS
ncbi:hypothetical protein AXG93_2490s1650 [Marchantia polymorpha subsp. ruderalis]|uniref:Actin-binding transcription modulator n=1 Tax=Marchantia polymorpha subsp. ruderalis TaxID=1480154 RepID=A0A176W5R8_MARPO|nr:hypothetical protein AXG93_2490s1650 [Marchantia polymorpha subsp. ruderalis]